MALGPRQVQIQSLKQMAKLMGRMKLAQFMHLPEEDFEKLLKDLEQNSLFKKLTEPGIKVIKCKRFPWTRIAQARTLPLDASITPSRDAMDVESFLKREEDVSQMIKNLGVEKFKKYFLDGVPGLPLEKIAESCGLTPEEVKRVNGFVDRFYLESKLSESAGGNTANRVYYSTIASIEATDTGFIIGYFSPDVVKGRYVIDFERLDELKKAGVFAGRELAKMSSLLNKLRLVNSRKTTIYQIIQNIIEVQRDFLTSGKLQDLKPFTQVSMSKKIDISPSLMSRAIRGKAIRTPQGRQIALKSFFPTQREIRKRIFREIFEQERRELESGLIKRPYSDEEIRKKLKENYDIDISRRSVTDGRKNLNIPSSFERGRLL